MINRDDMLELTRRMTPKRTCFFRIAGCYLDAEGYVDGTFNLHFQNLSETEKKKNLELAKTVPFASANKQLKEYAMKKGSGKQSIRQLLEELLESELKNDAMMDVLYDVLAEKYQSDTDYAIFAFYGSYDIPVKGTDGAWQEGSEEVYDFIIVTISPLKGEYEPDKPVFGFLYPAFSDRSADWDKIDIFDENPDRVETELNSLLMGK